MRRMSGASSLVMTAAATSVKSVSSGEIVSRAVVKYREAAAVQAILRAMKISFLLLRAAGNGKSGLLLLSVL